MNLKTKIFTLVFIFLTLPALQSQSKKQIAELSDLCKVWGSIKYFHPEIATGKHDWDAVLIAALPLILDQKEDNAFQLQVDKMLHIAGKNTALVFSLDKNADPTTVRNINHSWVEKSNNLTRQQKEELQFLFSHPYQGTNYYAQNNPDDDGNIITPNENAYPEMKMPDRDYRLLGLFRFWNVINYYFPYKYATDKPWDKVLTDMIPEFIKAKETVPYHKAILTMAASIDDGHGGVYPFLKNSVAGKYSPAFYFRLVDDKAVITKITDQNALGNATIREGSVIEKMNGISLKKRIKEFWPYIAASNKQGKYRDLTELVLNSETSAARYSGYNPDGSTFSTAIQLKENNFLKEYLNFFEMTSPITSKMITDDIAYVYNANLTSKNMDSIMVPLMAKKAIILDMRNYPSGTPVYRIANYFLEKPTIYSMVTRNDFRYPGLLIHEVTNANTNVEKVGKENSSSYSGKLILLVDYRTQSLAEFACLILQTYKNTTVIGTQTAGADGNQTRMLFPGNYKISFSGLGIYNADDSEAQRVGVKVDIPVHYYIEDYSMKKDPLLERAIEYSTTGK